VDFEAIAEKRAKISQMPLTDAAQAAEQHSHDVSALLSDRVDALQPTGGDCSDVLQPVDLVTRGISCHLQYKVTAVIDVDQGAPQPRKVHVAPA
jgi:hypothetical protein